MPYNLLLQKSAREALGFDLKDHIVVIDEAHSACFLLLAGDFSAVRLTNLSDLIDTILSIHSVALPVDHLRTASTQISIYYQRFKTRLKPIHAVHLKQCLSVIQGLIEVCEGWSRSEADGADLGRKTKPEEELFRINEITTKMKGGADQVNLIELVRYLKDSHLAQKVSGYMEKTAADSMQKGQSVRFTGLRSGG